jgi:hypothetical protein
MKAHVWELEDIDFGLYGIETFYICNICGAGGGPYLHNKRKPFPVIIGAAKPLPEDCDVAAVRIQVYWEKHREHKYGSRKLNRR